MSAPSAPSAAPAPAVFGEPTPLGLLGLAIGCASLVPIAFGLVPADPVKAATMFKTAAWLCLLFGAGCQFLSGLMALANKNTLGGTLLTTFSFNWVFNWWVLDQASQGKAVDPTVGLYVDVAFLLIFVVLTAAFGFYSKLLFVFLAVIDALYVIRLAKHVAPAGAAASLSVLLGVATLALAAVALYLALAILLNAAAGRVLLPLGGPLFAPGPAPASKDESDGGPSLRQSADGAAPVTLA